MSEHAIYFAQEGRVGPIKIGCTRGLIWARLNSLQVGNPRRLQLIGVIRGVNKGVEKSWHNRFEDIRMMGEWFAPTRTLLAAIEAEAQMPGWMDAVPQALEASFLPDDIVRAVQQARKEAA